MNENLPDERLVAPDMDSVSKPKDMRLIAPKIEILHTGIKTYQLRIGRMTDAQRRNYNELFCKWCIPYSENKLDFAAIFANSNPVIAEIGFGMGQATAIIAEEHPGINYIGIEVHKPGIGRLMGLAEGKHLTNLRIIEHDALEALQAMFDDNSVSAFHIFFPDPWQKKRHNKRRLITRGRTDLIASKLIHGGYLYMVTDWDDYAAWALKELTDTPNLINKYNGFAPRQEWRPVTKFEARGEEQGRKIKELYFVKQ